MNSKKIGVCLLTFGTVFSLSVGTASATIRSLTVPLQTTLNGAYASIDAVAKIDDVKQVFDSKSTKNYKVTFTNTYGITMTKTSWREIYDSPEIKTIYTWGEKSYLLSDPNKKAVNSSTKEAWFYYNKTTDKFYGQSKTLGG